ncbi:tryptophan halogenase family protein [Paraglaciecola arctica]|uniref:FADH2 O2-dependent halogenase I n=1 Tax=Paraglaciecola arctica BSs20135 TaxID=493475 RepID=K6YNQ5_9ALTE|nr:tryptophan halogenase family protein [Paraglaciecola arctica]GAC19787.1 FADH2 O2-dependent halogenase I [Paraglaciecola arctica BSs20135]
MNNQIKRVVIVGGGTAGWMAAAALSKLITSIEVTLIESDEIGTVGVGEATIPTLIYFSQLLKIDEAEFLRETQATFKLGINFENWRNEGEDYFHGFGITGQSCWAAGFQHFWRKGRELGIASDFSDYCLESVAAKANKFAQLPNNGLNYAYHFDATLYGKYLRKIAEQHKTKRVEGMISKVNLNPSNGDIQSLTLKDGQLIEGDLFLDCSGQRALLIEGALHTGFIDWSHWLPNDSAIALQTESVGEPVPYTRSIAHKAGWQWQIPLQHRVGNGVVYCSQYITDDKAQEHLLANVEGEHLTQPRVIKFKTGTRRKHWNKNCIAVGLSSGFLEPLESTSIHLIQQAIVRLMRIFPVNGIQKCDVDEFNQQTDTDIESIRDFIILHYKVTQRTDSDYWLHCRNMTVPDSLAHRLELFEETGRVFRKNNELFDDSWMQVMIGQGLIPKSHHPIVDNMSNDELKRFLQTIKDTEQQKVAGLPTHQQFIQHFCATPK